MEIFGTHPDGTPVHTIALTSDRLEVRLLTLGARLQALHFDGSPSLVPASRDVADALGRNLHAGPVIAPVINRIAGATVELDGRTLRFEANQDGRHTLHSGSCSSQRQNWQIAAQSSDAVTLTLGLSDGDGGFPGNRRITARYSVEGATLTLDLTATTDKPTLMNMGQHPYWNLDASDDWSGHQLQVAAEHYLPADADTIPTGEVAAVAGTPFDLRQPSEPSREIDHNYCLDAVGVPPRAAPAFAARLTGTSGRTLDVLTTAPGLQVFTGKPMAIAIEPQLWPDAPHHPHFPSIRLDPDQTFHQLSHYVFST